jgi:hypothetical protein
VTPRAEAATAATWPTACPDLWLRPLAPTAGSDHWLWALVARDDWMKRATALDVLREHFLSTITRFRVPHAGISMIVERQ